MRHISIAILGALLLFCYAHSGSSQGDASTNPAARKFKHTSKVETIYDKDKNLTTTYLRPMTLRYTNDRALTVSLDGAAENLGSMEIMEHRVDGRMSAGPVRYVVESLELPIRYESFLRITKARKTTMILGRTELQLQNEHLEAFRDLISRVE